MCDPGTGSALLALFSGAGGATAAGATAAAATTAGTLQTIGAIAGIGGALATGIAGHRQANQQARLFEEQARTQAQIDATTDERQRRQARRLIRQQSAELMARGVSLDSPTAIMLGDYAARELAFESQATRSSAQATQTELSFAQRGARAQGMSALLTGGFSAASKFLTAAPDVWPELLR